MDTFQWWQKQKWKIFAPPTSTCRRQVHWQGCTLLALASFGNREQSAGQGGGRGQGGEGRGTLLCILLFLYVGTLEGAGCLMFLCHPDLHIFSNTVCHIASKIRSKQIPLLTININAVTTIAGIKILITCSTKVSDPSLICSTAAAHPHHIICVIIRFSILHIPKQGKETKFLMYIISEWLGLTMKKIGLHKDIQYSCGEKGKKITQFNVD